MSASDINILEKLEQLINEFNPKNNASMITLAIMACLLFIPLLRAINGTSVEESFMGAKQRGRNAFFRLLALLTLFILSNYILLLNYILLPKGELVLFLLLLLGFGALIGYIVYDRKEAGTRKNMEDISELNSYYKEKKLASFLSFIICISPNVSIIIRQFEDSIPPLSCAAIVSIVEVLIICILIPEFVNRNAKNYFLDHDKRIYIYERVEDDTVLCGDNPEISRAKKYIIISYDNLKEKIIFHMQYDSLSRAKRKELREKYKSNKKQSKEKTRRKHHILIKKVKISK